MNLCLDCGGFDKRVLSVKRLWFPQNSTETNMRTERFSYVLTFNLTEHGHHVHFLFGKDGKNGIL